MTAQTEPLIVIGENIHTTRVLLRKGPRLATIDGADVIKFTTVDGIEKTLTVPDSARKTQDWEQGRVKHVKVAIDAAMQSGPEAGLGLDYLRAMAASEESGAYCVAV